MAGPMVKIKTLTRAINLDIGRKLNMGKNKVLEFIVPDPKQFSKWKILLTIDKGFDRITSTERTRENARDVNFVVADPKGAVALIIGSKDLHVRLGTEIWAVDSAPKVADNEAQVFDITCKTRTERDRYFDSKRR